MYIFTLSTLVVIPTHFPKKFILGSQQFPKKNLPAAQKALTGSRPACSPDYSKPKFFLVAQLAILVS